MYIDKEDDRMTTKQNHDLNSLRFAVSVHDSDAMRRSLNEAIIAGNSFAAIRGAITQGLEDVRHRTFFCRSTP
jgi:predicted methyltransferase MtxX (methanogen marker protein 4)